MFCRPYQLPILVYFRCSAGLKTSHDCSTMSFYSPKNFQYFAHFQFSAGLGHFVYSAGQQTSHICPILSPLHGSEVYYVLHFYKTSHMCPILYVLQAPKLPIFALSSMFCKPPNFPICPFVSVLQAYAFNICLILCSTGLQWARCRIQAEAFSLVTETADILPAGGWGVGARQGRNSCLNLFFTFLRNFSLVLIKLTVFLSLEPILYAGVVLYFLSYFHFLFLFKFFFLLPLPKS